MPVRVIAALLIAGAVWHLGSAGWLDAKAWLAQRLIARAWAGEAARPWPWADMRPVARLGAPRLQRALYVLSDASDRSLAFGPGVWQGGVDVADETLVLAGHRDTHFALLRRLMAGDELVLQPARGAPRSYRVSKLQVLDTRYQTLRIAPRAGELILVTCYPFDAVDPGGPLRYVVIAEPVAESSETRSVRL